MRELLFALLLVGAWSGAAFAQEDKKTDDLKPADPDTGESTVQETTLGLLPNPFEKYGVKFAATYIGEALGNPTGGLKQSAVYEGRLNLAVDVDLEKLAGLKQLTFHANIFQIHGGVASADKIRNLIAVEGNRIMKLSPSSISPASKKVFPVRWLYKGAVETGRRIVARSPVRSGSEIFSSTTDP
jgi:hypothetical protein